MVINIIALRDQHNFEGSSNLHVSTQEIDNRHQVTVFLTQACKREESKKIIGRGRGGCFVSIASEVANRKPMIGNTSLSACPRACEGKNNA